MKLLCHVSPCDSAAVPDGAALSIYQVNNFTCNLVSCELVNFFCCLFDGFINFLPTCAFHQVVFFLFFFNVRVGFGDQGFPIGSGTGTGHKNSPTGRPE